MGSKYNLEILAPAGSYDIFIADIAAGADAVYLGGDMFGARAYAGNFGKDELLRALDYAHVRDRRIYLTVNTLLKERELTGMLIDYLAPYYEAGLDAVIVQDMGVFKTIHDNFPALPIHASTQMTVTGSEGAAILKSMGASRVVTARELSLSEIKNIHDTCDIEIESFVHGALCYCYSGQCLFSSMKGARSGNRGRCAQPCRLAYDVIDNSSRLVNSKDESYALSPKDMCALNILPDIAEAGVYSLKIEGRMKNVTYAAGVTAMYRKYVDMLNERGREGYKVSKQDINELMDMYNRGAFTTGYYDNTKGKTMMSLARPNHMGTKALEVVDNISGKVTFKALADINPQDVFEIDKDNSFTSGECVPAGRKLIVNLPKKYALTKGKVLYRTRNNKIAQRVIDDYVNKEKKTPVKLSLFVEVGQPLRLMAETAFEGEEQFCAYVEGNIVQAAVKQPAEKDKLAAQVGKLGNTDYVAEDIYVELIGDAFVPVGEINDVRRKAIEVLTNNILESFRRNRIETAKNIVDVPVRSDVQIRKSVLVTTIAGLNKVAYDDTVSDVYIDYRMIGQISENKHFILALPHILRGKNNDRCRALIKSAIDVNIDTFLIRNLEEIGLVAYVWKESGNVGKANIILDANLYVWNSAAVAQYKEIADKLGLELIRITLPYELKKDELTKINTLGIDTELVVRGRIPLMVSEQCVRRTYGMCDKANGSVFIKDAKGQVNKVCSYCDYCYSVIYSDVYDISGEDYSEIAPDVIRYELVDEECENMTGNVFDGHFNAGVE